MTLHLDTPPQIATRHHAWVVIPATAWDASSMQRAVSHLSALPHHFVGVHTAPDALVIEINAPADALAAAVHELEMLSALLRQGDDHTLVHPTTPTMDSTVFAGVGRRVDLHELATAPVQVFTADPNLRATIEHAWRHAQPTPAADTQAPTRASVAGRPEPGTSVLLAWTQQLPPCPDRSTALARSIAVWLTCATPESWLSRAVRRQAPSSYNPSGRLLWLGGYQWFLFQATSAEADTHTLTELVRSLMDQTTHRHVQAGDIRRHLRMMSAQVHRATDDTNWAIAHRVAIASGSDPFGLDDAATLDPPDPSLVEEQIRALFARPGPHLHPTTPDARSTP